MTSFYTGADSDVISIVLSGCLMLLDDLCKYGAPSVINALLQFF